MTDLTERLKQEALAAGFDAVGICTPRDIPEAGVRLKRFLAEGMHGEMDWMARRSNWRGNPEELWPEARSVIMLAHSYTPDADPLGNLDRRGRATISVYARNRDYHEIIKKKLKRIGGWLIGERPGSEIKVFVDTAPVMEKPLAQAAGIGWQGKHTNLVSRNLGSWFFLGALFTTVVLRTDRPEQDLCGSCRRCLDVCPTDAFPAPYRLDARRCISYLTIEHKGPVDHSLRPGIGNRIFGCDDCLAVCPWNKFAVAASEIGYQAREELRSPRLASLAVLTDRAFRETFRGGPVRRIGRSRFVRNVLYAIGNSADPELIPVAAKLKGDPDQVVKDAAAWALQRLTDSSAGSFRKRGSRDEQVGQ